ncbi:MAG: hypothetical protein HQL24_00290 [Candidatus Omnitrophica bacterium]|nr:hypothetical protein [Candidatus Omnitrophota bacterium]
MNKRGAALIICLLVIVTLVILVAASLQRSISERSVAAKYLDSAQALWLAESGLNKAIVQLRSNYTNLAAIPLASLAMDDASVVGEYSATITSSDTSRTVTAHGFVPSSAATVKSERVVQAIINRKIPAGFYDYAIYAAGNLEEKGNVVGGVIYGGTASGGFKDPQPTVVTPDPSINPLALLDFDQIKTLSKNQGNYHSVAKNCTNNKGQAAACAPAYPTSFWYDAVNKIPNVVFLEDEDFTVSGNATYGGFIVVGGGGVTYDATINGTVSIDGCIYTRGDFTINGGGHGDKNAQGLNLNNIWVGGTTTLGGSSVFIYRKDYADAIKALNINPDVQITSWKEVL